MGSKCGLIIRDDCQVREEIIEAVPIKDFANRVVREFDPT